MGVKQITRAPPISLGAEFIDFVRRTGFLTTALSFMQGTLFRASGGTGHKSSQRSWPVAQTGSLLLLRSGRNGPADSRSRRARDRQCRDLPRAKPVRKRLAAARPPWSLSAPAADSCTFQRNSVSGNTTGQPRPHTFTKQHRRTYPPPDQTPATDSINRATLVRRSGMALADHLPAIPKRIAGILQRSAF